MFDETFGFIFMKEEIEWFRPEEIIPDKDRDRILLQTDNPTFRLVEGSFNDGLRHDGSFCFPAHFEHPSYDENIDEYTKDENGDWVHYCHKIIAWAEMPKGIK